MLCVGFAFQPCPSAFKDRLGSIRYGYEVRAVSKAVIRGQEILRSNDLEAVLLAS
jgi:hypothetical protein